MFLGQIFAKNANNDPKKPFEASKSVKKENRGEVRNNVKSAFFYLF